MNSLSMPNYDNGHDNNYDNEYSNDYNDYGNDYGNKYDNNYDNNCNNLGNDLGNEHDNDHENDNISTTSNTLKQKNIIGKKKMQNENGTIENLLKDPKNSSAIKFISVDNIKLRDMFATWIVNRQRLFTIIEDPELIEIVKYLNPTAKLVKGDTIKN
ncbi:40772_t:CDS:2, partial [Gigaspora margarita]